MSDIRWPNKPHGFLKSKSITTEEFENTFMNKPNIDTIEDYGERIAKGLTVSNKHTESFTYLRESKAYTKANTLTGLKFRYIGYYVGKRDGIILKLFCDDQANLNDKSLFRAPGASQMGLVRQLEIPLSHVVEKFNGGAELVDALLSKPPQMASVSDYKDNPLFGAWK